MTKYILIFFKQAAGKYRQQGRNYVVEDGDIIFFKFNAGAGLKDAKKKWWHALLVLLLVHMYINMILFSCCVKQQDIYWKHFYRSYPSFFFVPHIKRSCALLQSCFCFLLFYNRNVHLSFKAQM